MIDNLQILCGDSLEVLKTLPDESVNCCVTSPPYYALRDYGMAGQIGQENTPEAFVNKLVLLFREVRRVLRNDGTLWLNLGDSYVGTGDKGNHKDPKNPKGRNAQSVSKNRIVEGLKSKDLIGIPWMVAFALRADGWYLRQDIIWHKPNPMPESVTDRCTKAHEYIFLLTKSAKYYYDHEAIKVPSKQDWGTRDRTNGKYHNEGSGLQPHSGLTKSYPMANKRSVWSVTTKPYKGAHFAVFPPDLIEPCIKAGCPKDGIVLDPFGGSGTTGQVALEQGKKAILIELNPEYIPLIEKRCSQHLLSL
jgi:DNA modification methylase